MSTASRFCGGECVKAGNMTALEKDGRKAAKGSRPSQPTTCDIMMFFPDELLPKGRGSPVNAGMQSPFPVRYSGKGLCIKKSSKNYGFSLAGSRFKRRVIACEIGSRGENALRRLWTKIQGPQALGRLCGQMEGLS